VGEIKKTSSLETLSRPKYPSPPDAGEKVSEMEKQERKRKKIFKLRHKGSPDGGKKKQASTS